MADWRIRPLPQEMIKYAREDTHYLIYIYERMKQDLNLRHCLGNNEKRTPKESKDSRKSQSKSSQIAPVKEESVNLVLQVWNNSRSVCMKRYRIPRYEEMYPKFCRTLTKTGNTFNNQQSYALQELFLWRDRVAREEDESPHFVMQKHMMIKVVTHLPNEPEDILRCCSHSRLVQKHLPHLHNIMLKARALTTISTKKTKMKNSKGSTATVSSPITRPPAKKRKIDDVTSSVKETRLVHKNLNVKLIDLSGESKHVEERSSSKRMKMCKVVLTDLTRKIDAAVVRSGYKPGPVNKSRKVELIDLT